MAPGHGRDRAYQQKPKKKLLTTAGAIVVHKGSVLARSSHRFSITPLLQQQILKIGQEVVYSKASEFMEMFHSIDISAKQIDRVCHLYGGMLHSAEPGQDRPSGMEMPEGADRPPKLRIRPSQGHLDSLARPGKGSGGGLAYVMMDGSFLQFRSGDGSHKDLWKEIKMGRIFKSSAHAGEVSKGRNAIMYSDYVASLGNVRLFTEKMEARLDGCKDEMVFINDGAQWIWNWVGDTYPEAVQILDYFHAVEYLKEFAGLYFKDGRGKSEWTDKMEGWLNADRADKVIEAHRELMDAHAPMPEDAKKKLGSLISYFENNKSRMEYKTYREKGYLVGSGPIESANRNIIQKRLKLSGQRWSMEGAQNMATLRAFAKSDRWDEIVTLIKAA